MRATRRRNEALSKLSAYLFLIVGSLFMLAPFIWMLSTSLKAKGQVFTLPLEWIPKQIVWTNFETVLKQAPLLGGLANTLIVILPPTIIGLFTSALAAYAFAKMKFPGREVLFMCLLATMMIPGVVTLIPSYILFKSLGWIDSWKPLMIPGMFGAAAAVFFLRQFFRTIPTELEDAARIDGLNPFGIFMKVMVPLSKPALAAQGIFGFLGGYNDFLGPIIYINTPEKFTLQLVLASFQGFYTTEWTYIMAGALLALIPTVLLFFFAQRFFIEGITMTGMKG